MKTAHVINDNGMHGGTFLVFSPFTSLELAVGENVELFVRMNMLRDFGYGRFGDSQILRIEERSLNSWQAENCVHLKDVEITDEEWEAIQTCWQNHLRSVQEYANLRLNVDIYYKG